MNGGGPPIAAGLPENVDSKGAFPRFDEEQMARFRALGESRKVASGYVLFAEGDEGSDFSWSSRARWRSSRDTGGRTG